MHPPLSTPTLLPLELKFSINYNIALVIHIKSSVLLKSQGKTDLSLKFKSMMESKNEDIVHQFPFPPPDEIQSKIIDDFVLWANVLLTHICCFR